MKNITSRAPLSISRAVSTASHASLSEKLLQKLKSRRIPLFYDYLHPQPSHLLNLSLIDLFSGTWFPQCETSLVGILPSVTSPPRLAAGHHLVYFPPQVTLSQLLPDGTDILHSPGHPFSRRLWAGGRIKFAATGNLLLDGSRAVCIETIRNVSTKGKEGEEKVFVGIERRIGTVHEGEKESDVRKRIWKEDEEDFGQASIIENRNLVFMREKSQEQVKYDKERFSDSSRVVKPPGKPEFRHSMKPTKALLFRFSALTFNAHSIHLDKAYTQDVEGYRDLLVHGPLSLTLLLTTAQAYLAKLKLTIRDIEYRNLTPIYVGEELGICGKPKNGKIPGAWDVWIENREGGLAVRGTIHTEIEAQNANATK
ncbi:hypothetical protein MAP00_006973 [Monascus purpureus]|nr:hypothetical protein MAP00_006973 [Monascus purpureus]